MGRGGGGNGFSCYLYIYAFPSAVFLNLHSANHYIQIHLSYTRFMSIHLSIFLSIIFMSIHLSIFYLSDSCLSIYLSFIYQSYVYPSIYLLYIRFMSIHIFIILFYLSTDMSIYYKYICQIITLDRF